MILKADWHGLARPLCTHTNTHACTMHTHKETVLLDGVPEYDQNTIHMYENIIWNPFICTINLFQSLKQIIIIKVPFWEHEHTLEGQKSFFSNYSAKDVRNSLRTVETTMVYREERRWLVTIVHPTRKLSSANQAATAWLTAMPLGATGFPAHASSSCGENKSGINRSHGCCLQYSVLSGR